MFLVYNSDVLYENDFRLSIHDRAFQYGDGLFETIRYEQRTVWFWPDHFARLTAGMAGLGLQAPDNFTADAVYQCITELVSVNSLTDQAARIKIQVWRQAGGLYTPITSKANVLITVRSSLPFSVTDKAQIGIYDTFRLSSSPVSAFKTLSALPYVLAGVYRSKNSLDDVILLDTSGFLAECLASNLFWYTNQTLFTPSLQTGCINGIIRRQLLRFAPELGISLTEGLYLPDVLTQADVVFCTNVMGIQWLRNINGLHNSLHLQGFASAESLLNALFAQLHS
ncbi:aminotransferase class IV [Spirosoma sp. BT702]|uniref:branched-chain-amino-acid transaminase n=1 Tax=Spirosoma profusum TaxID=2771354 RepID=A0A926XWQ6_9BACT|nr:aminotransferase class IV [Spirosoma profusum]MBD2702229.1 aminotransferase class IV [Spirosoma profusum]